MLHREGGSRGVGQRDHLAGAPADVIDPTAEPSAPPEVVEAAEVRADMPWPPVPLVRTCQATTHDSEAFGPMVAAEADRRNFFAATSRVFLGDGGPWIWKIHRTFFPTSSRSSISCMS